MEDVPIAVIGCNSASHNILVSLAKHERIATIKLIVLIAFIAEVVWTHII
jgi:hypothetical protein